MSDPAGLTAIPRYEWWLDGKTGLIHCDQKPDGDWVKWADVARAVRPVAPEWQPIATVPDEIKDNQTPILLWTPHTAVVGSLDNGEWFILGSRYVIEATH